MDTAFILEAMNRRGCTPNPPATDKAIDSLVAHIGHCDPRILDLYRHFDGLAEMDTASWIAIWSIEEIMEFKPSVPVREGHFCFADACMNASIFQCSQSDFDKPVLELTSDTQAAKSLLEFWACLLNGRYDL